jgi:fatty-acyl-CoA synthase
VEDTTCSELLRKAGGFAAALDDAGVDSGDVVLIFLNYHPDMAACYLGVKLTGAIPSFMPCPSVKLHPERYWPAHLTLLQRIRPKAIVTDAAQAGQMKQHGLADATSCFIDVDAIEATDELFAPRPVDPSRIALLQHSSGTTGLKKGMALSHEAILNQVRAYARTIDLKDDDTIVNWLLLYHDMGLITSLIMPMMLGRTVVQMDPFSGPCARRCCLTPSLNTTAGSHGCPTSPLNTCAGQPGVWNRRPTCPGFGLS